MKIRDIEIINYVDFKNRIGYKKYASSVEVNLVGYYGFITLTSGSVDGRSLDAVSHLLTNTSYKDLEKGQIVYYRTKNGWGLPYLFIFYRENT